MLPDILENLALIHKGFQASQATCPPSSLADTVRNEEAEKRPREGANSPVLNPPQTPTLTRLAPADPAKTRIKTTSIAFFNLSSFRFPGAGLRPAPFGCWLLVVSQNLKPNP
jgi:hypothetical protein